MFSGIVQAVSKKVKFEEKDYGYKLSVTVPANFTKKLKKGDSVAVNGVCLTVVDFKKDLIEFDVVHTSLLKRANRTMEICIDEMGLAKVSKKFDWRLNERHYGSLQGLNKAETAEKHGDEQVLIWRRSYDIPPRYLL